MGNPVFSPLEVLECLSRIFPVQGAVIIGAGMGNGPWFSLLQQQGIDDVLLIEAEPASVRYLKKKYASHRHWSMLEQVVGDQVCERTFYSVSNRDESSLLSPDVLKTLWPNISIREKRFCHVITLDWLIQEKSLNSNWLVIDALPAVTILNGALDSMVSFDVIIVRQVIDVHLTEELYQDVDAFMQQKGYIFFCMEADLHPSIGYAVYVKDVRMQTLELIQVREELVMLQNNLLERQADWEKKEKELLRNQKIDLLQSEKKRQQLDQCQDEYGFLMEKILLQLSSYRKSLKEVEAAQVKNMANVVKQIESFLRIQNALNYGELLVDFHVWSISPDIGVFLLEKIYENHYDLIIEFGSGSSTVLLAKSVEAKQRQHLVQDGTGLSGNTDIVSFESDKDFYEKTSQMLYNRRLDGYVKLVHAPLIDWSDGEHYLYYDCQSVLSSLALKYANQKPHILLFVDGPPGTTCTNARYPAIPLVFSFFYQSYIDVVLDDANRKDEKAVVKLWREFWSKGLYSISDAFFQSEKGIYFSAASLD